MKKLVDDLRLIYKCCCLYYIDGLSQQEICEHLNISRTTVSRMLKLGRDKAVVDIKVNNPISLTYGELERKLEKKFHLKEVVLVDYLPLDTKEEQSLRLNEEAFKYFSRLFEDNEYIGVSMGLTLDGIVQTNQEIEEKINCTFVPVVGGISPDQVSKRDIHANNIATNYAAKFGGRAIQFFAPALFTDQSIMNGFMKEKTVLNVIKYYSKLSTVIMGLGIPETRRSTLIEQGYIKKSKLEKFVKQGAVGDVLLKYFDQDGNIEEFSEFNDRVSGLHINQLKKVPNRVCIAARKSKANAIIGAINGNLINILITDLECAEELLQL